MANVVVDASVAIKWVIAEPGHEKARELLKEFVYGTAHLIAPRTFPDEISSALAKRVRMKSTTLQEARQCFDYLKRYRPAILDGADVVENAFEFSLQHHMSYWDALYLALAMKYRCDLVTADARFHRGAAKHYPYVRLLGR